MTLAARKLPIAILLVALAAAAGTPAAATAASADPLVRTELAAMKLRPHERMSVTLAGTLRNSRPVTIWFQYRIGTTLRTTRRRTAAPGPRRTVQRTVHNLSTKRQILARFIARDGNHTVYGDWAGIASPHRPPTTPPPSR